VHDFVTTLDYPQRKEWSRRGRSLTADDPSPALRLRRVLAAGSDSKPIVLDGFDRADTTAAALLATTRRPAPIVMTDCTWKVGGSVADRTLTRIGIRALDGPRTTFCVSSTAERERWPELWGIPAERIAISRWYHGLTEAQLAEPTSEDGPIFSGGRSLRDYEPLLRCAAELPQAFRIAAERSDLPPGVPIPPNVTVGPTSHDDYLDAMRTAALVVVALERREDRSAGQTTYLNSMAMGKLTLVTDTLGVSDHVEDRVSGLIVPARDPRALADAIRWSLDPANAGAVAAIRARGRAVARDRFGPDRHVDNLLAIVDEVIAR
jgi:hypothetical protein